MKKYYAVNLMKNKKQVVFVAIIAKSELSELNEHTKIIKDYFSKNTILHVEEILKNEFDAVLKNSSNCYELSPKVQI